MINKDQLSSSRSYTSSFKFGKIGQQSLKVFKSQSDIPITRLSVLSFLTSFYYKLVSIVFVLLGFMTTSHHVCYISISSDSVTVSDRLVVSSSTTFVDLMRMHWLQSQIVSAEFRRRRLHYPLYRWDVEHSQLL